ncbi:hypothetical protein [Amphritea japonica]|uniref:Membrane-bound metal-dependent hydrolase n=1 Tax=Amphritea japonica ATCC BAA-1530 TaxID=1278309 RepID=A0A7R6STP2_9GAMM|nr:hypothetical protein [Amphritea japonica]BBB26910.1 conserved hypothetical protein [Amphritea japonica ATCC BAA-1530]
MFAGHIGAALAIGKLDRKVGLGPLIAASLLIDLLLWAFILLGWESVAIPENFTETHQPSFIFPFSHSLSAAIIWSALAGVVAFLWYSERKGLHLRAVFMISIAVLSHWLLDFTVHNPQLPLLGEASFKVGLGLWDNMPIALLFESFILVAGLFLFLSGANISGAKKIALSILCLTTLAFTIAGMTIAPPPPSAMAMAESSIIIIAVICVLAGWLGKEKTA